MGNEDCDVPALGFVAHRAHMNLFLRRSLQLPDDGRDVSRLESEKITMHRGDCRLKVEL